MRVSQLLKRNLVYYWRTNAAVVLGVAAAVAVLAGDSIAGEAPLTSVTDLLQALDGLDGLILPVKILGGLISTVSTASFSP